MTSEEYKAQIWQARLHFKHDDFQAALDIYEDLLRQHPKRFWLLFLKAVCLSQMDRLFECEEVLQECMQRFPEKIEPRYQYAFLLSEQGYYRDSIEQFKKCISLGKDTHESHFYLSCTYFQTNNFSRCIKHLKISLKKKITWQAIYCLCRTYEIILLKKLFGIE